jgi:hypothetical protein
VVAQADDRDEGEDEGEDGYAEGGMDDAPHAACHWEWHTLCYPELLLMREPGVSSPWQKIVLDC